MEIIDKTLTKVDDIDLIEDILILDDVEIITESVFEDNQIIKKIEAPSLKKIANKAFYGCHNLYEVKAPLLEEIGDYAFAETSLTNFNFDNVLIVGKNAFENTSLNSIELPRNLKKIGKFAFANNKHLQKVNMESLMTKIKDGMFENCINLKEIKLPGTINKFGVGSFKNCKKLNTIDFPEHLKAIETNCFWECESLKKVNVNNELEVINDYAFGYTKIDSIDLSNLKSIGKLPFHMCNHLESVKISDLFNNEIFDTSTSKLREIIIQNEKIDLLKPIKKIINYNELVVIRYNDESFQIASKPVKYYDLDYFNQKFPNFEIKSIIKNDLIFNIFYWESILGETAISEINPISFIALPPNINMIKAYFKKHIIYDEIIETFKLTDFKSILAIIKFITIFGGLNKRSNYNLNNLINKIGLRNIIKGFYNVEVKEFNQNFTNLYKKLSEIYSYREINGLMPFLYNNIEKVINLKDNLTIEFLEAIKFTEENEPKEKEVNVIKNELKGPNYEWLDTTSISNLLRGYILASVADKHIDDSDDTRKVLTYYIKDEENLIVATARAYYSSFEKYLLFNSITLSQSYINKGYTVDEIKTSIIDYVLEGVEEIINFFNEQELVVTKVHVGISEKSINDQLLNKGTKVINQNI